MVWNYCHWEDRADREDGDRDGDKKRSRRWIRKNSPFQDYFFSSARDKLHSDDHFTCYKLSKYLLE